MARLSGGTKVTGLATGLHPMGDAQKGIISSFTVVVRNVAGGFGFTVRGEAPGDPVSSSTSTQLQYSELSAAGTVIDGTTAITANGNYVFRADGLACALHVTAGTADVTVIPLKG